MEKVYHYRGAGTHKIRSMDLLSIDKSGNPAIVELKKINSQERY